MSKCEGFGFVLFFKAIVHSCRRNTSFPLGRRVMVVLFKMGSLALSHHPCLGGTMALINARKESRVDDGMTPVQIHRSRARGSLTVP